MAEVPGLSGAVALLAGGGPGLGAATAEALGRHGAHVVVVARQAASIDPIEAALRAEGLGVSSIRADLTSAEARAAIVDGIRSQFGRLDILVYNASSIGSITEAAAADLDEWRHLMEVNVWSALALVQESLPLLQAADAARIVLVSAMTTRTIASRGRGGYAISKAALNQLVKTLAYELAGEGIRVNGVVPGWMETPAVAQWRDDPARREHVERALSQIPLGRIPTPAEVAGTVIFLASGLSGSVTGELIDSNGGQYMRG